MPDWAELAGAAATTRGRSADGGGRRRAHGILAFELGPQAGQAVAHGVHAVHGVGEVGLELEDGGAVAHAPHHRAGTTTGA